MSTLNEFFQGYVRVLKGADLEEVPDLLFYRPLAYLGVRPLGPTSISPNQVTFVSLAFGILAGVLVWISPGNPGLLLWAAVAAILFNVFDCMDGMVARMRGTSSPFGEVLDGLAGYLGTTAIMVGIAHVLSVRNSAPLAWWGLTLVAGVSQAWWCAVVDAMRAEWNRIVRGRRQDRASELAALVEEARGWREQGTHLGDRAMVRVYVAYVRLWNLDSKAAGGTIVECDPPAEAWAKLNRPILRLALVNGPTMQLTAIVLGLVLNRLEWFLFATIIVGNLWAVMVLLMRASARRKLAATLKEA